MMAPELSSNWKKLQAKIKAESASKPALKRKAGDISETSQTQEQSKKRQKVQGAKIPASGDSKRPVPASSKSAPKSTLKSAASRPQKKPRMGSAVSSQIDVVPKTGVAPSLALWAEDNDISPEDLAEAYGLGIRKNAMLNEEKPRPNEGLASGFEVGKYVAMDCEMVGIGDGGHDSALGRVSIVDFHGRQVYDSFVRPAERVTDWRSSVSGVSPRNMATARSFAEVQSQVAELLKGKILVGHDLKHDLEVLALDHPFKMVRDTAKFHGFKKYGNGPKPALRILAKEILGIDIQSGQHSSIEDARVAMLLFRKHKPAFDVEHMNRYPDDVPSAGKAQSHGKKSSKKKRKN